MLRIKSMPRQYFPLTQYAQATQKKKKKSPAVCFAVKNMMTLERSKYQL